MSPKILLNLWLSVLFVNVIRCQSSIGSGACDIADTEKLEEAISKAIVLGRANSSFPYDFGTARQYCSDTKALVAYGRKFAKKCAVGLPKQVIGLITFSMNRQIKKVCKTKSNIDEMGMQMSCMKGNLETVDTAWFDYMDSIARTIKIENTKKIPAICCSFSKFIDDATAAATNFCSQNQLNYIISFINGYVGDVLDMFCSSANSASKVCTEVQTQLSEIPLDANRTQPQTMLPYVIEMMDSF
jgi:hypothetical protein